MRALFLREMLSIWPVLVLWGLCLLVLCGMTAKVLPFVSWQRIRTLLSNDEGSAYSIGYLLTLPLYMLFIAFFIELSFIMVCKTGLVYAGFAGARAGIAWSTGNTPAAVDGHVAFVTKRAFVPFASGLTEFRAKTKASASTPDQTQFVTAYRKYNAAIRNDRVFEKYVAAKYRYAFRSVQVQVERKAGESGNPWDEDFTVVVRYAYPFGTLGIGRAIGERGPDGFYVYPLESRITLKSELPRNADKTLGIEYFRLP